MTLSYLVSTAGHARHQNEQHPHDVQTILQLIKEGAEEFGDETVVGFTSLSDDRWLCDRYSFTELLTLSNEVTVGLKESGIKAGQGGNNIVSLLCPTGLDFLLAWIALMRMGCGVVFIAPQCSPSAINHLLTSTSSTHLVYHPKYAELADHAAKLNTASTAVQSSSSMGANEGHRSVEIPELNPDTVSHIFHTSGTSGDPKPIPHTHRQSVAVLPRRSLPSYLAGPHHDESMPPGQSAAFTTTPLFHGGVSDLLRAWMARSMIYFYPTSDTPITAENVLGAVNVCRSVPSPLTRQELSESQLIERERRFTPNSFLSVPYILTVLSEDIDGPAMAMLRHMDLVSTGGAPLDTKVGDQMVKAGVNLFSRLGSSECGFLLTSHRDYQTELDWEWLRNDSAYSDALVFEPVDGDKCEMIVTQGWTSKTKTNRPDGSYATGDLYERHTTKKNVWRYAGRGDDVIVMSNGEKASPGPIEAVCRSSALLADALVVGSDRSQLGLLLFPRPGTAISEVRESITSILLQANQSSPSFAHVSKDMCHVVESDKTLPKSSKGTVQRGVAYTVFAEEIQRLYNLQLEVDHVKEKRSLTQIADLLQDQILEIAGTGREVTSLHRNTDLFSWGVNSLMATRLRTAIHRTFDTGDQNLPINIVFEKPTISRLAKHIFDLQERNVEDATYDDSLRLMADLVDKYTLQAQHSIPLRSEELPEEGGKTIVLTGATGSLGSFLLVRLGQLPLDVVHRIVCLVRAKDDKAARTRVEDTLAKRELDLESSRFEVLAADLPADDLGLASTTYARLINAVDVVIHAAWPVHFASGLVSFEDSIKGTRNLLNLVAASQSQSQFYYCSSLASVLAQDTERILELPSDDPTTASPIGYSRSKWVTEKICRLADELVGMQGRIHILRVGQLCGDTQSGHWNEKEGWPLLIRTAQVTGCLPNLEDRPSWLPVDLAAQAITEVVTRVNVGRSLLYHVVHPSVINWTDILDGLRDAGLSFERVPPKTWLAKVEASSEDVEENPSRKMSAMWQAAYGGNLAFKPEPIVDTTHAQLESTTLHNLPPLDSQHIGKMVAAWRRTGFLE
ncbi:hypothetical protein IAR55_004698 [Kwoniella newhampshirensis]|uniref:Carrier domain-containing protein n=1 Tax=Kwoniella newhampshirensis TaxID=1651941 RepID=A0AAW0YLM0_9TREE